MYTEKTITGNNIMDLSYREILIIRDSLIGVAQASHHALCHNEKLIMSQLIKSLDTICTADHIQRPVHHD